MSTQESVSRADFDRLRSLIRAESGINLSPEKKTMVEVRLKRRLQSLGLSSYADYCRYVFAPATQAKELAHLIDAVSTNKTDFFREPDHFAFLTARALPELDALFGAARRPLVWSAGCSTGEEPYSLAMALSEYAETHAGFRFAVLATDINTAVLEKARLGVFQSDTIRPVPRALRKKYFLRSRDPQSEVVRMVPEIRVKVEFRRLNFMEADYGLPEALEIIFCRNVIIYFDRATQIRLLERLVRALAPGGYFFAGHSESLQSMELPLELAGPAVYRKWK
ncbi:MAG TPA: protein-glutamate O-methyltransferase CheR [Bryobacteraceae bacterium]|nr:protein-glutamate O-methyltransferase CheR [Bryobacteraceae bacterium]